VQQTVQTDDESQPEARQWIGPPISDAVIRHLDWESFEVKRQDEAVEALRTQRPKLYQVWLLGEGRQADMAEALGINQGTVSKRLRDADRFLAEYLLAPQLGAVTMKSFASIAKMLGFSRKQLARELLSDLKPYEVGAALSFDDPQLFVETMLVLKEDPARIRQALKALESDDT
jgi:DNA-binding protein Fis